MLIVIKLSQLCHGTVIALRCNTTIKDNQRLNAGCIKHKVEETMMELLEMREENLIDEWADYEDYEYTDDATEL